MNKIKSKNYGNIAFLSTYPPTECGIATFTEDLVNAMDFKGNGIIKTNVIAITGDEPIAYDEKVLMTIRRDVQSDYVDLATKLNNSNLDLLVIEHEYGIFGGEYGEYILDLVNNLEIGLITTHHTILSEPTEKQRAIINILGKKSDKIVTMARNTKRMLHTIYGVDTEKIEVIHHGVPKKALLPRESLKTKFGYENKQVISTFGLLSPGKGIEHGIEAMAQVVWHKNRQDVSGLDHKDVIYLILGQTHPALKEAGTAYRKKLEALVEKLNLTDNVKFVNKYLSKTEIITYLQMSDIYMTPYLAKDQAVSGTLAYAVGYGKAIVSTPYLYAQEMLSDGNGLLAEFAHPESIAACINQILDNPFQKKVMEKNTAKIGQKMYWDSVALQYTNVMLNIITAAPKIGVV